MNQFIASHEAGPGNISRKQERFLIGQKPAVLARHRLETGVTRPIPKLSRGEAYRLIRAIMAAQDSEAGDG